MKQYRCPNCNSQQWVPCTECPDCGTETRPGDWHTADVAPPPMPAHPAQAQLLGDSGRPLTYRREPYAREYGRQLLACASSEARYAGRCQFLLEWKGDNLTIRPGKDTPCDTIVDGQPLRTETTLQQGSSICLRGRRSGREAMRLIVILYA